MDYEKTLDHYLQGHFHPDIAPQVRREITLGTISIEGFMRLADIFQANHEALDAECQMADVIALHRVDL